MSEEVDRKLYAHYKGLSEGKLKTGNPVRDELIVSDAKKHLADLIAKTQKRMKKLGLPEFIFEEEAKGAKANVDGKDMKFDEAKKEWKEAKPKESKK